jgi:hypothetical protein
VKIRAGFVANSSSTNFVVAFPRGFVATPEAVKAYLFARRSSITAPYYTQELPIDEAVKRICAQMRRQRPNGLRNIHDALRGSLPGRPQPRSFPLRGSKTGETDWKAYEAAVEAHRKAFWARKGPALRASGDLYVFTFADDHKSLEEALLRHGHPFRAAPHITIDNS